MYFLGIILIIGGIFCAILTLKRKNHLKWVGLVSAVLGCFFVIMNSGSDEMSQTAVEKYYQIQGEVAAERLKAILPTANRIAFFYDKENMNQVATLEGLKNTLSDKQFVEIKISKNENSLSSEVNMDSVIAALSETQCDAFILFEVIEPVWINEQLDENNTLQSIPFIALCQGTNKEQWKILVETGIVKMACINHISRYEDTQIAPTGDKMVDFARWFTLYP